MRIPKLARNRRQRGFTLAESMIVTVIAMIVGISILSGLYYINGAQKYARERTHAHRVATSLIENARQTPFNQLRTVRGQTVTIDDNRTPTTTADDTTGTADLIVRRASDGTEIAVATGENLVVVEATVTWWTFGSKRTQGTERRVSLFAQFAP